MQSASAAHAGRYRSVRESLDIHRSAERMKMHCGVGSLNWPAITEDTGIAVLLPCSGQKAGVSIINEWRGSGGKKD